MMDSDLKLLQDRIVLWADSCPDLRALLVVGSQARRTRPADEWSDLDLMLFMRTAEPYLANQNWIRDLGPVLMVIRHETGDGDAEYLVVFEGGHKVDLVFYGLDALTAMVRSQQMAPVYQPGYAVLVDKDGLAAQLPPVTGVPVPASIPSNQDYQRQVETFWYGALYVAKQLRRGNLWVAKYRDWTLKEILLTMLEWHARAIRGWDHETWHDGHAMGTWTDEDTWGELHQVFGHFSAADSWRALLATTGLYRRLAAEVAGQLAYTYSEDLDRTVSQLIDTLRVGG